jgi:Lipoprotein LpqB beta-propeller domain/Sporulation and spore germination
VASRLRAAGLGLLLAASVAGCVSIPNGGPVQSFAVTAGAGGQGQLFMQRIPPAPQASWSPTQVVEAFVTASGSLRQQQTARRYLTPASSKTWNPGWSAIVYSKGPFYKQLGTVKPNPKVKGVHEQTATVVVTGKVQAQVHQTGGYAVASAKSPTSPETFHLVRDAGGPWRISATPENLPLLLDSFTFSLDYQQRNLYFFDPNRQVLVPDPVYVPLYATPADLMGNLVTDLKSPPLDWLSSGATVTAFPPDTKVGDVTLEGTSATVNLTGNFTKVSPLAKQQVSSQLYWTLTGSGQGVQAVKTFVLVLNGKPWYPPGNPQNPVQSTAQYSPPTGRTSTFYYLDSAGYIVAQAGPAGKPTRIGPSYGKKSGFSQIAVSPPVNGVQYLAALRGNAEAGATLYTGPLDGKLVDRGPGYTSMSWGPNGDLWTTAGDQIYMLHGAASPGRPAGQPVPVAVPGIVGPFTAIRVAPDGVRVAIIGAGSVLNFGAITREPGARASQQTVKIELSPFYVAVPGTTLTAVTWYGPDNVITLGTPGPVVTEYAVNSGASTSIPPPPLARTITASWRQSLIAGVAKSGVWSDISLTGAWAPIIINASSGNSVPVKGVSPVYPG